MLVLSIIGGILGLVFIYWMVVKINELSYEKSGYEYFTPTSAGFVIVGYYFLFFGFAAFSTASHAVNGDILNGILLMIIGGVLVGVIIVSNFINTPNENILITIIFSSIQLIVYVGLAYVSAFILLLAFAALSQTKPVYVLNNDSKY